MKTNEELAQELSERLGLKCRLVGNKAYVMSPTEKILLTVDVYDGRVGAWGGVSDMSDVLWSINHPGE